MSPQYDGCHCKPASLVLGRNGNEIVRCETECPFPFCVVCESRNVELSMRYALIDSMKKLNMKANDIAEKLNMSTRSTYKSSRGCYWCNIDTKSTRVFCRHSLCTVAFDGSDIAVVFAYHRHSTKREFKTIKLIMENMFPSCEIESANDRVHDHWTINNISISEAKDVFNKMEHMRSLVMELA